MVEEATTRLETAPDCYLLNRYAEEAVHDIISGMPVLERFVAKEKASASGRSIIEYIKVAIPELELRQIKGRIDLGENLNFL